MQLKCIHIVFFIAWATGRVASECANATNDDGNILNTSPFTRKQSSTINVGHRRQVSYTYTPAVVIIGKKNGGILRCLYDNPEKCEVYHKADAEVTSALVHGEFLFVSLSSGAMLRCIWRQHISCQEFNKANTSINCLTIRAGRIYAGLGNGTLWQCHLNVTNSCLEMATFGSSIRALTTSDTHIFAGLTSGKMFYCSILEGSPCLSNIETNEKPMIVGLALTRNTVIELKAYGVVTNYTQLIANSSYKEVDRVQILNRDYKAMAIFRRRMYVLQGSGMIRYCSWKINNNCTEFVRAEGATSLSFVYATHQSKYRYQREPVWKGSLRLAPPVFYYEFHHRLSLEVTVKDDRIYQSHGTAVDTLASDVGQSGRAAIFALGADGQLLLSNLHREGSVTAASLFAGNEVAGVGEMVVENGTITKVVSCSEYYWPDRSLNLQVLEALYFKGYVGVDKILLEDCLYGESNSNDLD